MKILYILVLTVFFVSCGHGEEKSLDLPFRERVTFSDGELTVAGVLFYDGEEMIFCPDTPEGYKITVTKDSGVIEYEGIVFSENVLPSSRFLPLFEMLGSIGTESVTVSDNPLTVEKENIKITFSKDKK